MKLVQYVINIIGIALAITNVTRRKQNELYV